MTGDDQLGLLPPFFVENDRVLRKAPLSSTPLPRSSDLPHSRPLSAIEAPSSLARSLLTGTVIDFLN